MSFAAPLLWAFFAGVVVFTASGNAAVEIIELRARGELGRPAALDCLVVPPNVTVQWRKDGQPVSADGEWIKIINETLPLPDKDVDGNQKMYQISKINIRKSSTKHHGNYTCVVFSAGAEATHRHVSLDLKIPAAVTQKTEGPLMRNSGLGASLTCTFKGFGPLEIKWKKENDMQRVLDSVETKIINETHTISTLNLTDLTRMDNGTYLCGVYDHVSKRKVIDKIDVLVMDRPQMNIDYVKAVGSSRIFLNWTVNNGNSPIESYTLQYRKNGSETWTYYSHPIGGGNSSFVMEGLEPMTEYQLKISAKNSLGTSQVATHLLWVKTLEEDPDFVPEPMINGFTVSSVTIGWVPPSDELAEYIHYYELLAQEKNNDSNSKKIAIQDYRNQPYMFDKLAPATTYIFKVRACSELTRQCGNWSLPVKCTTVDGTSGPPSNITVECGRDPVSKTDYLTVSWQQPLNPNGKIMRYNVELTGSSAYVNEEGKLVNATWGPKIKYASDTSRTARFDNLLPNTNYTVQVTGVTRTKRPGDAVSAHCSSRSDSVPQPNSRWSVLGGERVNV